ncbi:hypothetical protein CSUI_001580 [Cystoisospora suis]|uniref:Uncharacterized protein n=1 Tax=Cystoisospora suis TaxID=483139 RepID=A0A2C6LCG0_9APIC|nr:hypothetical protein CSUI_001580 [Cystoisospora suis]
MGQRGLPMSAAVLLDAAWKGSGLETSSSEMTPKKLGRILLDIRSRGAVMAQQQYASLQGEYAVAYNQYLKAQEELKPHKEAADKILGQVDDQLRKAMEQAAKYRLQHHKQRLLQQAKDEDQFVASTSHPKYAAIMGGLSEECQAWVNKIIFPYQMLKWQLEESETALWVKHSAIAIAQEVYSLWSFEGQQVEYQLTSMKEEEEHTSLRAEAHERFLQRRLQEIRLENKQKREQRRQERHKKHRDDGDRASTDRSSSVPSSSSGRRGGGGGYGKTGAGEWSSAQKKSGGGGGGDSSKGSRSDRKSKTSSKDKGSGRRSSSATTSSTQSRSTARSSKVNASEWL